MRKPTEVRLKYKEESNGSITMLVDQIMGITYKWQYCKTKTADWQTINAVNKNIYTISNPTNGDKYRCLVTVGNRVISYSKVLTIG